MRGVHEPSPRPLRRGVGLSVALLVVAVTAWAVSKHVATGGLVESKVERGLDAFARGLQGDLRAFESAEEEPAAAEEVAEAKEAAHGQHREQI